MRPHLDHGILELDNNAAERGMRAIALGRKNYLFVGSKEGGKAAAIACTLIETARLNAADPHASSQTPSPESPITSPGTELARGQRPLRPGDFGRLAALLAAPDDVELAPEMPRRGPVLVYRKRLGNEETVALFEVRTGRRRLALVTMWVKVIAGASPTATP